MTNVSIDRHLDGLLKDLKETLPTLTKALQTLEWKSPYDNNLTIGGELLRDLTGGAKADCDPFIWINVELDAKEVQDKIRRMWPSAIRREDVTAVTDLHTPMFDGSWQTMVEEKGMIPPADIMDILGEESGWRIRHYLFLTKNEPDLVNALRNWGWFENGQMAIIYPIGDDNCFKCCWREMNEVLVDDYFAEGNRQFSRFVEWLCSFQPRSEEKKVSIYYGHEHGLCAGVDSDRVWAAFSGEITKALVTSVLAYADHLHRYHMPQLRAAATSRLNYFWLSTANFDHDDIVLPENQQAVAALREFLGWKDTTKWPANLPDETVRNTLKTMCGKTSLFTNEETLQSGSMAPLSLLGAFFLFLGAVASQQPDWAKRCRWLGEINPLSVNATLRALPPQPTELARASATHFYDMLSKAVVDKHTHVLAVKRASVPQGFVEVQLKWSGGAKNQAAFAAALRSALTEKMAKNSYDALTTPKSLKRLAKHIRSSINLLSPRMKPGNSVSTYGSTSGNFIEYWVRSQISGARRDQLPPVTGGLKLESGSDSSITIRIYAVNATAA